MCTVMHLYVICVDDYKFENAKPKSKQTHTHTRWLNGTHIYHNPQDFIFLSFTFLRSLRLSGEMAINFHGFRVQLTDTRIELSNISAQQGTKSYQHKCHSASYTLVVSSHCNRVCFVRNDDVREPSDCICSRAKAVESTRKAIPLYTNFVWPFSQSEIYKLFR